MVEAATSHLRRKIALFYSMHHSLLGTTHSPLGYDCGFLAVIEDFPVDYVSLHNMPEISSLTKVLENLLSTL